MGYNKNMTFKNPKLQSIIKTRTEAMGAPSAVDGITGPG